MSKIKPTDADGNEDKTEVVTDGGEGITEFIDDETIEDAIEREIGPVDHPDTPSAEEIREGLAWLQQSMEEVWADWCSNLEHNECGVVYEDTEVIIFRTGEHNIPRRDVRDHYPAENYDRLPDVVSHIHHTIARDRTDYDWGYEYPLVVAKSGPGLDFDGGQRYVEAVVNGLQKRGLTPGQAWAYYGVEIRGESRNTWGKRKGDSDHKNVSDALKKAKKKLPKE